MRARLYNPITRLFGGGDQLLVIINNNNNIDTNMTVQSHVTTQCYGAAAGASVQVPLLLDARSKVMISIYINEWNYVLLLLLLALLLNYGYRATRVQDPKCGVQVDGQRERERD